MIIAIASGKGGTGKTTFAVNLAYALADEGERVRLLDCDVEEPNDHLFVKPSFSERRPVEVPKPVWNEACTACGQCAEACHYNAIAVVKDQVLIFDELCHACGVCSRVCPEGALSERPVEIGSVEIAPAMQPFFFAHGTLNIAEARAPAVIQAVKKLVDPSAICLIDASPGTSCPVVEAVSGADVAVLVTEPTPFGLNDLRLAVGLTLERGLPSCIMVNRSDGRDALIEAYAEEVGVPIVGRIPFRREYAEAYSGGDVLVHAFPELRAELLAIFGRIRALVGSPVPAVPSQEDFSAREGVIEALTAGTAESYTETTIISGKGGSGKTTVVASLAMLADGIVLADNDVDAADLHLLIPPTVGQAHDFVGGLQMRIDEAKCTACGECAEACHFSAIRCRDEEGETRYQIDELACEGCGLCGHVCEFDAIISQPKKTGRWYLSSTPRGPMAHARLGIAEENSGRLVTQVRQAAAGLARKLMLGRILGDGPPGTGCPVIASVSGADRVLIVTEPTVSGVHDMERVLRLAAHFRIPAGIVINKADLNQEQAERIESIAREMGARILARIPFDRNVNEALMAGRTLIEHGKGPAREALIGLWNELKRNDHGENETKESQS